MLKTTDKGAHCNQQRYASAMQSGHMMQKSCNITNLHIQQTSWTLFKADTFILQHILLDIAKYILLILSLSFLSITPFHLWGSVGVVNGLLTFVYLLI